ncbi:MAG: glucan ABC transporter ATP-binding protein/ permease, partial [Bdellovibrionales bacterium]
MRMLLMDIYIRSLRILWKEKLLTLSLVLAGSIAAIIALFEPILFGHVIDSLAMAEKTVLTLSTWAGLGVINIFVCVFMAV